MRVILVATVARHIKAFHIPYLKWFKEQGWETSVCARNDFGDEEECNIPFCDHYYDMPFERFPVKKNNIEAYKQLKRLINNNAYDIIHCHTPVGALLARLAARKARKKGTRVIYTAHGFHFFKGAPLLNWLLYYPIERIMARYTDVLITINKEDYSRAKKFKAKQVVYIPGVGIDISKFSSLSVSKEEKRKELNIPLDAVVVLSVGELNKNKNHEVVIRAIAKLNKPNIHYVIAGTGGLESHLKGFADKNGVGDKLHLLGFRKDVSELCKASDVFCFPSLREGLPVSLMEAMACGLPVVCSKIRGNVDLIENEKGGGLCEPNDTNGFAKYIDLLTQDSEKREIMGKINMISVKSFSLDCISCKLSTIYKESD